MTINPKFFHCHITWYVKTLHRYHQNLFSDTCTKITIDVGPKGTTHVKKALDQGCH